VRLKRQFHILAVIGIYAVVFEIMHFYKREKSGVFAGNFVRNVMFDEVRQLQNLARLCKRQEVNAEKEIYNRLFHITKVRRETPKKYGKK